MINSIKLQYILFKTDSKKKTYKKFGNKMER